MPIQTETFTANIDPREDELERLGIDQGDFEQALYAALDSQGESLEAAEGTDVSSTLEDIALSIGGKSYRLGDLAHVSIEEAIEDDEGEEFDLN